MVLKPYFQVPVKDAHIHFNIKKNINFHQNFHFQTNPIMLTFIWNPAAASAGWIIAKLSGAASSDSQQTTIWYQIANSKQIIGGKIHINLKTKLQIATFENADSETDELFLYRLTQRWLFLGVLIPRYLENIFKKTSLSLSY